MGFVNDVKLSLGGAGLEKMEGLGVGMLNWEQGADKVFISV